MVPNYNIYMEHAPISPTRTRLEGGGRSYEYCGFLLLSQYDVDPPAAPLLCGDAVALG